jgi:protein tyrosine phosphatase (PTP) superfamily phosphohydrolase (DUF442 family)
MSSNEIYNYIKVNDEIATGGQPTAEELRSVADEGFTSVINLATIEPPYSLEDEAGLVQSLGMHYYHIPVEWGNPLESDFEAFESTMASLPAGKTLIHCAANFRVTAFYSLYAQAHLGWTEAQAEALRAQIWGGRDVPVWNEFIARISKKISAG